MENQTRHHKMHLFVIRVWTEQSHQGEVEWRGKAQEISSGKEGYFIGWQALGELLQTLVTDENDKEHKN